MGKDYISREDAKMAIFEAANPFARLWVGNALKAINKIEGVDRVDKAVEAKVEVITRPIYGDQGDIIDVDLETEYTCPICGNLVGVEEDALDNYCSNCGVKIEGVEE